MSTPKISHNSIVFELLERKWHIFRPASLEELWEGMTAAVGKGLDAGKNTSPANPSRKQAFIDDERIPYWSELWPASLALAAWLDKNRQNIKGRSCLDLGCGLGLTALVGQSLGAVVAGMDYEPEALYYARQNEEANNFSSSGSLLWLIGDWREPPFTRKCFDFIWAGDIMYERRFIEPVADFMEHALSKNGRVWLAEPGRNIYPLFAEVMKGRGWSSELVATEKVKLPSATAPFVDAKIWQLWRA